MTKQEHDTLNDSPFLMVFLMVEMERRRSLGIHGAWSDPKYTEKAMSAAVKAELAEVELSIELGHGHDVITELIHVGNTACKAATELLRRGLNYP